MNCKQDDLAIVVKSYQGNEGKIVRCVEFIPDTIWASGAVGAWKVEGEIYNRDPRGKNLVPDHQLRPIRDQEGEDETLTWAGKPKKEVSLSSGRYLKVTKE